MTMQPASTDIAQRTASVVAAHRHLEGPLLPILHGLQDEFGCVPKESLPVIAEALDLSNAEVHGVVTFYHDFRSHPAGRHVIKLCRAEACQSMGCETAKDGSVTLEAVSCLGLCACAPAALVDGEPVGRLDDEALAAIAAEVRA